MVKTKMKYFLVTVEGGNDEIIKASNLKLAKDKFIKRWNTGISKKDWDNPFGDIAEIKETTLR